MFFILQIILKNSSGCLLPYALYSYNSKFFIWYTISSYKIYGSKRKLAIPVYLWLNIKTACYTLVPFSAGPLVATIGDSAVEPAQGDAWAFSSHFNRLLGFCCLTNSGLPLMTAKNSQKYHWNLEEYFGK